MDFAPISCAETTLIIQQEQLITDSFVHDITNSGYDFNIAVDNSFNLKRDELIIDIVPRQNSYVKLNGTWFINSIKDTINEDEIVDLNWSNQDTFTYDELCFQENEDDNGIDLFKYLFNINIDNKTIIFDASIELNYGDDLQFDSMLLYKTGSLISCKYNSPIFLKENCVNNFHFIFDPSSYGTIDIYISYKKPQVESGIELFVEGFNCNRTKTQQRNSNSVASIYANSYSTTQFDYNIEINRLWFDDYFMNESPNMTYRIIYKSDDNIIGIEPQTYYLCGVSLNDLTLTQPESGINTEGVKGNACRVF